MAFLLKQTASMCETFLRKYVGKGGRLGSYVNEEEKQPVQDGALPLLWLRVYLQADNARDSMYTLILHHGIL